MEKQYDLDSHQVSVLFEPKLVRITGSEELLAFLKPDLSKRTLNLVKQIKKDYLIRIGQHLKITNESLMVEIWGHLYASKVANAVNNLIKLKIIENIANLVIERSDTIDCGEASLDSNRKFWDVLSKFNAIIIKFL